MKEKIAKWYRQGLWSAAMVRCACDKGVLTEDAYLEIVGGEVSDHE